MVCPPSVKAYYFQDVETGKQESLKTRDKHQARTLIHTMNEAGRHFAAAPATISEHIGIADVSHRQVIDVGFDVRWLFYTCAKSAPNLFSGRVGASSIVALVVHLGSCRRAKLGQPS